MDAQFIILTVALCGASVLQSATGIGFGIIAGPVMLIVLDSGAAIHISIVLSLLISLLLVPSIWASLDVRLVKQFLTGTAIGLPLGLTIFLISGLEVLKLLAGCAVLFTLAFVMRSARRVDRQKAPAPAKFPELAIGTIAGAMSGGLAMPGVVPAAWMSGMGYGKDAVRATILIMNIASYGAAFTLQSAIAGVSRDTLWLCAALVPATIAGTYMGKWLTGRLSPTLFRFILAAILLATALGLFADVAWKRLI
jgi:uncharacterized membrane protein YfcA